MLQFGLCQSLVLAHECKTSLGGDDGINTAIRSLDQPLNDKMDKNGWKGRHSIFMVTENRVREPKSFISQVLKASSWQPSLIVLN